MKNGIAFSGTVPGRPSPSSATSPTPSWGSAVPDGFAAEVAPETQVKRDVRQLARVSGWTTFRTFLRLGAGRTAQDLLRVRQTWSLEVDTLIDDAGQFTAAEVKSAATPAAALYANLLRFGHQIADRSDAAKPTPALRLIYGAEQASTRQGVNIIPWNAVASREW